MEKIPNLVSLFSILFIITVLFTGCALVTNTYKPFGADKQADDWKKWRDEKHQELQEYIGITKEQIKLEFGKPNEVMYNIKYLIHFDYDKTKCQYQTADEVWGYVFSEGIIPFFANRVYGYSFYFIDGKVVKTEP